MALCKRNFWTVGITSFLWILVLLGITTGHLGSARGMTNPERVEGTKKGVRKMIIPEKVENGTLPSIVLDCEYDLPTEGNFIIVKWFFNDEKTAIYQWIVALDARSTSEKFQKRIDVNHKVDAPGGDLVKHRALRLYTPTTDLSGKYTCSVETLEYYNYMEGNLIVYARPKFEFQHSPDDKLHSVLIGCKVTGAFPQPKLTLFYTKDADVLAINDADETVEETSNGLYEVGVSKTVRNNDLHRHGVTEFICKMDYPTIKGFDAMEERISYVPASFADDAGTSLMRTAGYLVYFPFLFVMAQFLACLCS